MPKFVLLVVGALLFITEVLTLVQYLIIKFLKSRNE